MQARPLAPLVAFCFVGPLVLPGSARGAPPQPQPTYQQRLTQGLHYYKGLAWYRTEVAIPRRFRDRKLFLWFGGVDEAAKVLLNGTLLGQSDLEGGRLVKTAGTFKSSDFCVTDLVRFDRPNTIAVKIINRRLSEIGTGGITAPVMFWSPRSE